MRRFLPLVLLPALATAAAAGEPPRPALADLDRSHRALYEKVRPSIVGIRARGTLGDVSGTGILIDREGTILTSSSVVGRGTQQVKVWLAGPRVAAARVIGVRPEEECALIRIDADGLVPIAMGDSDAAVVGQRVYAIGNAENALINDDQAALGAGVLSGIYGLREDRMGSTYTGRVLETTAAVNPGIEGGALVDADGRLLGLLILNYSPLRWLGVAIPVNTLKPVIEDLRREAGATTAGTADVPAGDAGTAFFGADVDAGGADGGAPVRAVADGSPAKTAGIATGDRILEFAGRRIAGPDDLAAELKRHAPGALVVVKVDIGGMASEVKVKLGAQKK
jgi:S1-C subfamily serine protease